MAFVSRRINDCVPVALSNYFGMPYDDVDKELDDIYKSLNQLWIREVGVSSIVCRVFLARRNHFDTKVPRRGQYKMTGIIKTVNSNHDTWHMAIVKNGIVYDSTAPNGMDLPIWRAFVQVKNICEYWVKG